MSTAAVSQAGFVAFLRGVVAISVGVLPDDSPVIPLAYKFAVDVVNLQLAATSCDFYGLAVYNLGTDFVINYAPDVTDAPPYVNPANKDGLPYFAFFRQLYKVYDFTPGVVQSTSDEGTSVGLLVQKAAENFTLDDLQRLKTPFGRRYLQIAQKVGTLWGLT